MDASPLFASFIVMYLFLSLNRINKTVPALSSCFSTNVSFLWHLFVLFYGTANTNQGTECNSQGLGC